MAIPNDSPTLIDVAQSLDPQGGILDLAEMLNETNEMLLDVPFLEGNQPNGHKSAIRTGIPYPTWREFYGRVQPNHARRAQITDSTAMLEAYAEVDADLANLSGDVPKFRLQEDRAHIEGMSQTVQRAFIYGNSNINPNQFNGLGPRFNSRAAENGKENIIDAGGTGSDNASIWLVSWGPGKVFGIYPRGSKAGLSVMDDSPNGPITSEGGVDGDGAQRGYMKVYRTHYKWDLGLVVQDWRYVVRIANIDRSTLDKTGDTGPLLPELMKDALERLPNLQGRIAFYADRSMRSMIGKQLANKVKGSTLTTREVGGFLVSELDGVPIRRVDALSIDEARVQ